MRTTVTLDDDVAQQIHQRMRERGTGFKQTLNELLRRGLRSGEPLEPYSTPTFAMGVRPDVDLTKALRLAVDLDDEDAGRKPQRAS
ncbi:hypothetical protein [Rhabdothermincola sp.]|uniref:hypothetical protein n=1 Tax=Rhabdothermincola sp. TaxID=2820405 RepID=UPI002FDFCA51